MDCLSSLARSEASARTAARVARSAALAFDEEASILAQTMKKVADAVEALGIDVDK